MTTDSDGSEKLPSPGRYGRTNWMGAATNINATDEEMTWPRGRAVPLKLGLLALSPGRNTNATDEEMTWPLIPGGDVYDATKPVSAATFVPSDPSGGGPDRGPKPERSGWQQG